MGAVGQQVKDEFAAAFDDVFAAGVTEGAEHPFPAAIQVCWAGTEWVVDNAEAAGADPDLIAVGSDSAGGNLAAALTLMAREAGGPRLAGQLLVYPNTDQIDATAPDESMVTRDDPYLFNRHSVAWYRSHYLPDPDDADNPTASPLQAQESGRAAPGAGHHRRM
ncbi:hypothetical protein GCM10022255_112080 [Dactylosporangium darangshiense]|uniref:Alpha/beta hydrolase fold-3 domain-containing protein n=1 Tax=Dactylosporangium darangshiense TaxID=579108 RepID=A0ABP8DV22_9ACTN